MSDDLPIIDDFNGDDAKLIDSAKSLIYLSDRGAMVPHGIGGHARGILSAFIVRMEATPAAAGAQGEEPQRAEFDYVDIANRVQHATGKSVFPSTVKTILTAAGSTTPQPAAADGGVRERAREILSLHASTNVAWVTTLQALEAVATALSSHRQAGDLSKFRELAERWRDGLKDEDEITAMAHGKFADELLALVEKGAGS